MINSRADTPCKHDVVHLIIYVYLLRQLMFYGTSYHPNETYTSYDTCNCKILLPQSYELAPQVTNCKGTRFLRIRCCRYTSK